MSPLSLGLWARRGYQSWSACYVRARSVGRSGFSLRSASWCMTEGVVLQSLGAIEEGNVRREESSGSKRRDRPQGPLEEPLFNLYSRLGPVRWTANRCRCQDTAIAASRARTQCQGTCVAAATLLRSCSKQHGETYACMARSPWWCSGKSSPVVLHVQLRSTRSIAVAHGQSKSLPVEVPVHGPPDGRQHRLVQ